MSAGATNIMDTELLGREGDVAGAVKSKPIIRSIHRKPAAGARSESKSVLMCFGAQDTGLQRRD